jgi:predicted ThiF/HesA family dinucleotide-utilizing enzyme
MTLLCYMAVMDGPEPIRALDQLDPEVEFLLSLLTGAVRGASPKDFAEYIASRNPTERVHHVPYHVVQDDVEFVYGVVTEEGVPKGAVLSAARLTGEGEIIRYHSSFDTILLLADLPQT